MARYLVTGCAGFIGSHLSESLLNAGDEVVGVDAFTDYYPREIKEGNLDQARDHDRFRLVAADLAAIDLAELFGDVDGVFHLAAQAGVRGSWGVAFQTYLEHNLLVTQRVLEAAATAGVRVAIASSSSVYGNALSCPTSEHAAPTPVSPYGLTKLVTEQLATLYSDALDLDAVLLRYFTVYGPRQRPDMAFALVGAALRGEGAFHVFGDGNQSRDVTYVGDAVEATIAAFHRAPRGATYNVGGGSETSLLDALGLAEQIAGRSVPIEYSDPTRGDVRRTLADTRRIRAEVGWAPRVELVDGLAAQLAPYLEGAVNGAAPVRMCRTRAAETQSPLVTVVVPTSDSARHLSETLDSILEQTYPRVEIIVIDDASSDDTEAIATRYGRRIGYHRQACRRGLYANINDGVALARGEMIAVYHASDVYHPEIVAREVDYLRRHPDAGAVFCKDTFIDADGRPFGQLELPEGLAGAPLDLATVLEALLRHQNSFLRGPSSMVRAAAYREVGEYRPDVYGTAADLELWLRLARRYRIGIIDEFLFMFRPRPGSSSYRRGEPDPVFAVLDAALDEGGRHVASAEALDAYEAHRTADRLRTAVGGYVLAGPRAARAALDDVRPAELTPRGESPRAKQLALLAMMHGLSRMPRIVPAAEILDRRVFRNGSHRR